MKAKGYEYNPEYCAATLGTRATNSAMIGACYKSTGLLARVLGRKG
jgi:hypothetical protein